ncbi:MAG: hypothetical protein JSV31_30165, partial [Desulfobacterales bacterium]
SIPMLVIISDLHFTDGTTSNWIRKKDLFNINPDAFKLLVGKISNIIVRRKSIPLVILATRLMKKILRLNPFVGRIFRISTSSLEVQYE